MSVKIKSTGKLLLTNAFRFALSLAFAFGYQFLFGSQNILAGVAISVGFTMFPETPYEIRPLSMSGIILFLYPLCCLAGQLAFFPPWAAMALTFLLITLILALSVEPAMLKPCMSFLLCFVFCEATPVPLAELPLRLMSTVFGAILVAAVTLFSWLKKGVKLQEGRTIPEQIRLCFRNRSYIFRMAFGIGIAVAAGIVLHLKKPLWISIVVMSLTQMDLRETFERIKYRSLATIVAAVVFLIAFGHFIPNQYAVVAILMLGYFNFFLSEYKHKQIINTISAINASMVLLDPTTAIANRFLCLAGGIAIVLLLWGMQLLYDRIRRHGAPNPGRNICNN